MSYVYFSLLVLSYSSEYEEQRFIELTVWEAEPLRSHSPVGAHDQGWRYEASFGNICRNQRSCQPDMELRRSRILGSGTTTSFSSTGPALFSKGRAGRGPRTMDLPPGPTFKVLLNLTSAYWGWSFQNMNLWGMSHLQVTAHLTITWRYFM